MRVLYTEGNTNIVDPVRLVFGWKEDLATVNAHGSCRILLISAADGSAEVVKTLPAHLSAVGSRPTTAIWPMTSATGSTNSCDVFLYDTRDQRRFRSLCIHPMTGFSVGRWMANGLFSPATVGELRIFGGSVRDGKTMAAPAWSRATSAPSNEGIHSRRLVLLCREFHACDVYTASLDLDTGRCWKPQCRCRSWATRPCRPGRTMAAAGLFEAAKGRRDDHVVNARDLFARQRRGA